MCVAPSLRSVTPHSIHGAGRPRASRVMPFLPRSPAAGLDLFIGDASRDIAITVLLRTKKGLPKGTTHRINGDLDTERTLIVDLLRKAGLVTAVVMEWGMGRCLAGPPPPSTAATTFPPTGRSPWCAEEHVRVHAARADDAAWDNHHGARRYRIRIMPPPATAMAPRS